MASPNLAHDKDNNTMMSIYLIHGAHVKEWLPHQTDHWFSFVIWDVLILHGTFSDGMLSDMDV